MFVRVCGFGISYSMAVRAGVLSVYFPSFSSCICFAVGPFVSGNNMDQLLDRVYLLRSVTCGG